MSIFDKRTAFKPFEYPDVIKFVDAINHSYWLHSEWNFISDIQDFNTKLSEKEKNAIKNALLAISQIEVSVKSFWGKLHDTLPKPEFNAVGATFAESECFDNQTEVLTSDGWIKFEELSNLHEVAQYDIDTKHITFEKPLEVIKKPYNGKMHIYQGRRTDLCVTPNHELLLINPHSKKINKKKSISGAWGRNFYYPSSGYGVGTLEFTDIDRLLIAIQADGSLYGACPSGTGRKDFCFELSKNRKIKRIKYILQKLQINYTESIRSSNNHTIISGVLPDYIDVDKIKNFDYIDVTKISPEFCRNFIEELLNWDASLKTYYNSNEKAVDKVQIIATLGGFTCSKGINRTKEQNMLRKNPDGNIRKSSKTQYSVNITNTDKIVYPHRKEIDYDDMVYCVTMPKGTVVTRRGSSVSIQGNCRHERAYSHLLEVLDLNHDFEILLQNPVIQGRVDYLTKYLKGAADNNKEAYTLTLTLFSLFIENVSLFSQFAIIKSFNKYKNVLKDIDNVVQATQQEEQLHAKFGAYIVNQIKLEYPEWFDEEFYAKIKRACHKAYDAESKIIDWIFELGDLEFITAKQIKEFIKNRFNLSLDMIGCDPVFDIDSEIIKQMKWFDEEIYTTNNIDFFNKKSTNYSKKIDSINSGDLF